MTEFEKARHLFQESGLAVPTIPKELVASLKEQGKWLFSTRELKMSPYNLHHYVDEVDCTPAEYVVLSHSGHGANSYAIQYYLVYGPLRMFLHLGWGGVYGEGKVGAAQIAESFSLADQIVPAAMSPGRLPQGERLIIVVSDSYGSYWSAPGRTHQKERSGSKGPAEVLTEALHWLKSSSAKTTFASDRAGMTVSQAMKSSKPASPQNILVRQTIANMNALPGSKQVLAALPLIAPALEKYCWLQSHLSKRNVSADAEYQRRFTGFYRVRRGELWRRAFFGLLQRRKANGLPFGEALRLLQKKTSRVEASFASKLVATIDPHQPIIDSIVFKNLGLRLPARTAADRLERLERLHGQLCDWYREQLASRRGKELVRLFRKEYPQAAVTDVKAVDLVLWKIREAA